MPSSWLNTGVNVYFWVASQQKGKNVDTLLSSWPVFTRPFFLFAPFAGHPSSSPFLGTFFALFSSQKLVCSVEQWGTVQSLERGSFRIDLCTNFGKEIPSRNLREKRSVTLKRFKGGRPLFFLAGILFIIFQGCLLVGPNTFNHQTMWG